MRDAEPQCRPHAGGDVDLIVCGAGAAGMATALFAAIEGLQVLLIERSSWVGGTSALAAGALWIPNTHHGEASGDTPARAARYLQQATGGRSPAALRAQFLASGPLAVRCLEAHSEVQLRAFAHGGFGQQAGERINLPDLAIGQKY